MGRPQKEREHPNKKKQREIEEATILKRQKEALELRILGGSYRSIADRLSVSPAQAMLDVKAAIDLLSDEVTSRASDYRQLELHRLDELTVRLGAILTVKDQTTKNTLGAVDRLIKITEQRAKLLGLYMPVKVEHGGAVDFTAFLREIDPDDDTGD